MSTSVLHLSAVSTDDPRIDQTLQARVEEARKTDIYLQSDGRAKWVADGKRDDWVVAFLALVRKVAPSFGLAPEPTDAFVTAHAALSTGYGRSLLSRYCQNPFGVKGNNPAYWSGPVIYSTTTEYKDGEPYQTVALWRVYPTTEAAIRAHLTIVLREGGRYASAAEKLRNGETDYMAELGRDGWFTDIPEKVNAEWLDVMKRVNDIAAAHEGEPIPCLPGPNGACRVTDTDEGGGVPWARVLGGAALGYHGYRRHGTLLGTVGWGLCGAITPLNLAGGIVALVQGFGRPKGGR